ncbi:hypothetical protein [Bradyrhizobium sp.]|uniref:hypothetical protein n=1 Tax=Bradyrhizobium sp. TaxID=376 RepID=UPI003C4C094F
MRLVHFTEPNGAPVGINPDQVENVRDAEPGAYAPGARTVIVLANGFQAVREPRSEVESRLAS